MGNCVHPAPPSRSGAEVPVAALEARASVCPEEMCKLSPRTTSEMESKSLQILAEEVNYRRRTVPLLPRGEDGVRANCECNC